MRDTSQERLSISPVPPERWQSALELVLSQRSAVERTKLIWWLLQTPHRERLQGLLEARLEGRMVGAGLAFCMPGRTALVYQPRLTRGTSEQVAERLHEAMMRYLEGQGVRLAQEVLPVDAELDAAWARRSGFAIETTLLYYSRELRGIEPVREGEAEFVVCVEADRAELERLLERTYVGTLDCPELNGVRPAFDVVEGYLEGRPWSEHVWRFVNVGGKEVGCVLITPRPPNLCELVYLGLVPEARGRGLGKLVVRQAIELAKQAGADELTVAVDGRNTPACKTYEGAGFVSYDQRRVVLRLMQ